MKHNNRADRLTDLCAAYVAPGSDAHMLLHEEPPRQIGRFRSGPKALRSEIIALRFGAGGRGRSPAIPIVSYRRQNIFPEFEKRPRRRIENNLRAVMDLNKNARMIGV